MHPITESTVGGRPESTENTDETTTGEETAHHPESESARPPRDDAPDPEDRGPLPLDETFELLRNQRRRCVLEYLQAAEGQVTLSDLAEQIAAWENDKEVRQITSSERKRVYVGLYQCHLPKMDGMGVISFNKSRGIIERGKHIDAADPYLHRAAASDGRPRDWPVVGLSLVGGTVLPVVVLALSQSAVSLGVAAVVVLTATMWGVSALRGGPSEKEATPVEPESG